MQFGCEPAGLSPESEDPSCHWKKLLMNEFSEILEREEHEQCCVAKSSSLHIAQHIGVFQHV